MELTLLSDKQRELVSRIATGDEPITYVLKDLGIPISNYYYWRNNSQPFNAAIDEAIELKVQEARKLIKTEINTHIKELSKLAKGGKNEQARINAYKTLFDLAELFNNTQEITIKSADKEEKNELLSMLNKDKDQQDDEQIH